LVVTLQHGPQIINIRLDTFGRLECLHKLDITIQNVRQWCFGRQGVTTPRTCADSI
jgi:hypothetical protein